MYGFPWMMGVSTLIIILTIGWMQTNMLTVLPEGNVNQFIVLGAALIMLVLGLSGQQETHS